MMEDEHTGVGRIQPLDAEEFMEIRIREKDKTIEAAEYRCSSNAVLARCGETLCSLLPGHAVTDLFLTDNKVVYYNIDPPLGRDELYFASMAVFAAKRAAAAWCKKNNTAVPAQTDGCGCITNNILEEIR